ncbi:MAG: carboxymuconolactone decarboxylase family protein [Thermodesulfobacteriota bacterium]
MSEDIKQKTAATAQLYFEGYPWDRPYDLWRSFDPGLAKDLSLFITGQMYARQRIPHPTRQLAAVAALTALERSEELRLHIWAALRVGSSPRDVAEVIFQTGVYAGMPVVNQALKVLKAVLQERQQWPPEPSQG